MKSKSSKNIVLPAYKSMNIKPDEWTTFSCLEEGDDYTDSSFAGCEYRLPSKCAMDYKIAVNIKVTGHKSHKIYDAWYKTRVQIEFVGDGEPSTFTGGWLYSENYIIEPIEITWSKL